MRLARMIGWTAIAAAVVGGVVFRPDLALKTGAGVAAHNLCAATFTQGLDPDVTARELVRPMIGLPAALLSYHVDREAKAVEAGFGPVRSRAVYTQGYGCRLVLHPAGVSPAPAPPRAASAPDTLSQPDVVAPVDPAVAQALDGIFAEHPKAALKRVKGVVVLRDGKIIAERYAPGFSPNTPLLSYSVAKSFTNAILGVLVRQGKVDVNAPVDAPEWKHPADLRGKITPNDLLRMQSGLDAAETGSGFDPASQMLYNNDDMAGYVTAFNLRRPIGTEWLYTSANTLILDRALGRAVAGGAAQSASSMRAFADREIFQPLHMDSVTLEFDGAGTLSGSAHIYATARDYARFGMLYLNDGIAPDGRRILPEGWVAYSRKSTLGSGYGAGFWTNDGPSEEAAWRVAHGLPKDAFYASGNLGQRIYIIPSAHLVVARFGYSRPPSFGMADDLALVAAAIKAARP